MDDKIIAAGEKARAAGECKDTNPYEPTTLKFISWLYGWTRGQPSLF